MRTYLGLVQHSTASVLPQIIQPDPQEIYVTLTADCNLRCQGCRYGREFMHGHQLPWATVRDLLDDCKKLGAEKASNKKLVACLQPDRRVEIEVLGSRQVAGGAPAAGTGSSSPAGSGTTTNR